MKILLTSDWYEPVVNGVVTSVRNLKRELEKKNDTSEKQKQKPVKTKIPSKLADELGGNIEDRLAAVKAMSPDNRKTILQHPRVKAALSVAPDLSSLL